MLPGFNMDKTGTLAENLQKIVLFALLALSVGSCRNPVQPEISGSIETIQLYPDPVPLDFNYQPDQPILAIDFGSYSEKTIVLRNATGLQAFVVKVNSSTEVIPGIETGVSWARALSVDTANYPGRREHEAALLFNANPPPIPQEAQPRSLARTIAYGDISPTLEVGSTKTFEVEKADKTWTTITATLGAIGKYSYVWVANANYSTSSTIGDNKLTTSQAGLIRDKFDGTLENGYRDGIFRNVSTIFGFEFGGGNEGGGGQDGDQHISILLYDIDGDYYRDQASGIFGYFWGKDHFTQTYLDTHYPDPIPQTNLSEIFYLDAHFADSYPEAIYSTLAHEYQHMIHFNMKYVLQGINSATWFNEMCSMVAEDLVLENIGLDPVSAGPQSRLDIFAYHYTESGVSDWLRDEDNPALVLKSYAGAFAFGAYLARNFGGAAFFHELLHNDKGNEAAITAAMGALALDGAIDNGLGFSQELLRYGEALVLTANPAPESLRSFNREVTSILEGETAEDRISYTVQPINLASVQQYSLETGEKVPNSYGLRTYQPLDSPSLRPYGNSIHTQDSWADLQSELQITLEAPSDPSVKFYLVVR